MEKEKSEIINILNKINIDNHIKEYVINNINKIDTIKLIWILEKYSNSINKIWIKNNIERNTFNKKIINYKANTERLKELEQANKNLEKELDNI
jgi:hypothetical protein